MLSSPVMRLSTATTHDPDAAKLDKWIGYLKQREDMVGTVLFKIVIIKICVAELPGVHQHLYDLIFTEIEPVFPNIPALKIPIFLNFQVIRHGRKIAFEATRHASIRIDKAVVCGHVGGIINRIGQNAGLLGLALLIDSQ